jgi:hypothetical protein
MANGLPLPFQATSQGPGNALTIISNAEIQNNHAVAAISGVNTGLSKPILGIGGSLPVSIGVLGDSSNYAGFGVQGNSNGSTGV